MSQPDQPRRRRLIEGRSPIQQWDIVLAGSALLAALFDAIGLPAAFLLGR